MVDLELRPRGPTIVKASFILGGPNGPKPPQNPGEKVAPTFSLGFLGGRGSLGPRKLTISGPGVSTVGALEKGQEGSETTLSGSFLKFEALGLAPGDLETHLFYEF